MNGSVTSSAAIDMLEIDAGAKAPNGSSLSTLAGVGQSYLLGFGLVSCYVLFFFSLYLADQIDAMPADVSLLFIGWLAVFVVLVRSLSGVQVSERLAGRNKTIIAIWCNVGVVAAATLVGGDMRLFLLVGVVFGVLYCGLHFSEIRVRSLVLATLVAYALCVILKSTSGPLELQFELLCVLGLAVMLLAASLISREIIRLRLQARARNRQLSKALRRVEELAMRDELTGLYNRRHLLDFVGRAIASRERGRPPFALAYCDLDHFKRVNDRFGHECGDRLLQAFAKAALSSVRTNDLVARMGGEEFVLVLVDASESEARDIIERLRLRTARLTVSSAEPSYRITLSAGLAIHSQDDTVDSILRRADGALYCAKEQGRDRLIRV